MCQHGQKLPLAEALLMLMPGVLLGLDAGIADTAVACAHRHVKREHAAERGKLQAVPDEKAASEQAQCVEHEHHQPCQADKIGQQHGATAGLAAPP